MSHFYLGKIWGLHVSIYSILKRITMQKLTPEARKKKAERDLKYAKTPDRRAKKAHAQRLHRKHNGDEGKDWDHKDSRFESPKRNRGNDGLGQKPPKKEMIKRKDGSTSQRGLWDNIRANKGSGKKPTKAMLEQAKKITNKTKK